MSEWSWGNSIASIAAQFSEKVAPIVQEVIEDITDDKYNDDNIELNDTKDDKNKRLSKRAYLNGKDGLNIEELTRNSLIHDTHEPQVSQAGHVSSQHNSENALGERDEVGRINKSWETKRYERDTYIDMQANKLMEMETLLSSYKALHNLLKSALNDFKDKRR